MPKYYIRNPLSVSTGTGRVITLTFVSNKGNHYVLYFTIPDHVLFDVFRRYRKTSEAINHSGNSGEEVGSYNLHANVSFLIAKMVDLLAFNP